MGIEAKTNQYWIAPNAVTITLNALGNPNRTQGSVASGAVISCYVEEVKPESAGPEYAGNGDGLGLDNGRNPKRWPLSLSPTYFNSNTAKYVYVAIPRKASVGMQAVVVFPSEHLDIYGKNAEGAQIGSTDYFYVWLQGIISAPVERDGTLQREWTQKIAWGSLGTYEDIMDMSETDWYQYSKVTGIVTFLKDIVMKAGTTFRNLILNNKELTGVATAATGDEFIDSETLVVTPSYINAKINNRFIRKDQDDETPYSLGVGQNLTVGGDAEFRNNLTVRNILRAVTGYFQSLYTNIIQSENYSGDGIADTGFRLTNDDGTGSSALTVDNLHVRKKATFEELEVKKETAVSGNEIRSAAANVIDRTDYYDSNDNLLGYSYTKVPWLLRKMPFLIRKGSSVQFFGRLLRVRMALSPQDAASIDYIRCYFLAKDGDREVKNLWKADAQNGKDLIRCQTFNLNRSKRYTYIDGQGEKVGNVFWWRKAKSVSSTTVNIDGSEYHYVDVYMNDCATGSDIPTAGDHMVQFGNDSNPDRMNLIIQEIVEGDAPAIKAYMGIYTYDMNKCWWGGSPRKMMLSPKSGYEFYGPSFKYVQEYGVKRASIERGLWSEITPERDDKAPHANVRKCYYYDKVSHNGCYWLCVMSNDGAHWVDGSGNYLTQAQYDAQTPAQKLLCSRKENYTTDEPSTTSSAWQKQVDRGTSVKSVTSKYAKTNRALVMPRDDQEVTWEESLSALGEITEGWYVWTKNTTTYSDTLQDTVTYIVSKWGIDGDGIANIETKFYEDANMLTQAQLNALAENKWKDTYSGLALNQGDYIYTRTKITYDKSDTPTVSYTINRIADDGVSYVTTEEYYCLGTSNTTPPAKNPYTRNDGKPESMTPATMAARMAGGSWSESRPDYDTSTAQSRAKKYLWNFEVCYDTTANVQVTQPICVANYEKGISTIVETYAISAYDKAPSGRDYPTDIQASDWTDEAHDHAPTDAKPYQWNKTVTTYSDGSSDTFYHVSGTKGTKGRGITSVNTYFKADTTTPTTPSGAPAQSGWSDDGNSLITDSNSAKHLYESTCTTYSDGTYSWTTPIDDGLISDMAATSEEFALADSGTTAPITGWSASVTPTAGKWVWSRTKLTFKSGSPKYVNTQCVGYCGTNGRAVTNVNTYFKAATTQPTKPSGAPTSAWADDGSSLITKANADAGNHLYESTCTSYDDGTYSWTTPIDDGLISDMAATSEEFALADSGTTAPTTGWSASVTPTNGKWIWSRTKLTFKTGDPKYVSVQCVGYCGTNGTSPYFADIDNEMDSVACDKDGKTTAAYSKTFGVSLWHGSSEMTLTDIVISGTTAAVTATKNVANKTVTVSVANGTTIPLATELTITPKATGAPNDQPVHFVLNGIRPGAKGEPATIYSLVPSVSSVVKKKNNTYSVDNVSCTRQKNVGGTITDNTTDGTITYKLDNGSEQSYSNNTNIAVTNFTKSIQFIFKIDGVVVDRETILMVADGTDSTVPGPGGSSTIFLFKSFADSATTHDTPTTTAAQYIAGTTINNWQKTLPVRSIGNTIYVSQNILSGDNTLAGSWSTPSPYTGDQGEKGNDGYTVSLNPVGVTINQAGSTFDVTSTYPFYVDITITKGTGTTNLVSAVSITANRCAKDSTKNIVSASIVTENNKKRLKVTGVSSAALNAKYTQGYIELNVTADSKTFTVVVPVAINYTGTYIEDYFDDHKETFAEQVVTKIQDDGTFVENDNTYKEFKSATETKNQWVSEVNTPAATVSGYNERISNAEGTISRVETNSMKNNLFGDLFSGWYIYSLQSGGSRATKGSSIKPSKGKFGGDAGEEIVSPEVYLEAGQKYCVSYECDYGSDSISTYLWQTVDSTHIQRTAISLGSSHSLGTGWYYHVFTVDTSGNYRFLWLSDNEFQDEIVGYPKVEWGEEPSENTMSASEIVQTSNQISLTTQATIEGKLSQTGININGSTREINLIAGKVNFKANDGSTANPYMSIGSDGKLTVDSIQATNGNFSGTLRASLFAYKVYSWNDTGVGYDVPADADFYYFGGPFTSNVSVTLPYAGNLAGKMITLIQPYDDKLDWSKIKLYGKDVNGGNTGVFVILDANHQPTAGTGYPIGKCSKVVVWADPSDCANNSGTWHIMEQPMHIRAILQQEGLIT